MRTQRFSIASMEYTTKYMHIILLYIGKINIGVPKIIIILDVPKETFVDFLYIYIHINGPYIIL